MHLKKRLHMAQMAHKAHKAQGFGSSLNTPPGPGGDRIGPSRHALD